MKIKQPKISHSAWDKYTTCPYMYYLHYEKRLRPKVGSTSSAIAFGYAIDNGLNELLITGDIKKAIDVFRLYFKWEYMADVTWDSRDYDESLVTPEMLTESKKYDKNWLIWATMRVKGRMLLEVYNRDVYSLIEEVEHVQKELHDRPGVIDAIVKLRGHGRVLLDNKTSIKPYDDKAIPFSTQLALYAKDQGITKVGYVVLNKQIQKNTKKICKICNYNGSYTQHKTCPKTNNGKRCHGLWNKSFSPEAQIQLLVEDIPEINGQLIEESLCQVEKGIKNNVFPKNLKACNKIYGNPCPYINYCWKQDETGLEIKPKQRRKDE